MSSFDLSQTAPASPQMWAFYAVAATTLLYVVFVRPMHAQRKDPLARSPGDKSGGLSRQRTVERQMETLLVELSEMARQITGQLDTRAAKLEILLKEADDKIAAMQAMSSRPPEPSSRPLSSIGAMSAAPAPVADPPPMDDPRHREVYILADAGMNAAQIAQRLSRPAGEVELILALRPRK